MNLIFTWQTTQPNFCSLVSYPKNIELNLSNGFLYLCQWTQQSVNWKSFLPELKQKALLDSAIRNLGSVKIFIFLYALVIKEIP